jgi:hypothetical protein
MEPSVTLSKSSKGALHGTGQTIAKASRSAGELGMAVDATKTIQDFLATIRIIEVERTKREHIRAHRDEVLAAISASKEIILEYAARSFEERQGTLNRFYTVLDKGLSNDDPQLVDSAVEGIVNVLQNSPLDHLAEFARAWSRPDYLVEL